MIVQVCAGFPVNNRGRALASRWPKGLLGLLCPLPGLSGEREIASYRNVVFPDPLYLLFRYFLFLGLVVTFI